MTIKELINQLQIVLWNHGDMVVGYKYDYQGSNYETTIAEITDEDIKEATIDVYHWDKTKGEQSPKRLIFSEGDDISKVVKVNQ